MNDGRLLVRGSGLFDGYQGESTGSPTKDEYGWWDSGDRGAITEQGQVSLTD